MANYYDLEGFDECVDATDVTNGPLTLFYSTSSAFYAGLAWTPSTTFNRGSGQCAALTASGITMQTGTSGVYYAQGIKSLGANRSSFVAGIAIGIRPSSLLTSYYISFQDGATSQFLIRLSPSGAITLERGSPTSSVVLATAPGVYNVLRPVFIEVRCNSISGTTGAVDVWINKAAGAAPDISVTNVNNKISTNTTASSIAFGFAGTSSSGNFNWSAGTELIWIDDYYLGDTQMGNMHIVSGQPSGAGSNTQWTPSAGANYAAVDDTTMNVTDYIAAATVGLIDTYTWSGLTAAPLAVNCIAVNFAGTAAAGADTISPVIISNGTTNVGSAVSVDGNGYYRGQSVYTLDPGRGVVFTPSTLAAVEFGVKRIT